ncbi:MAG: hypothetical protein IPM29_12380 [Planctomycetes bacterium]|nr:hypothetical protein [Planctomycetota bacterium]
MTESPPPSPPPLPPAGPPPPPRIARRAGHRHRRRRRAFEFGEVLGTSFGLWLRRLPTVGFVATIVFAPVVAFNVLQADIVERLTAPGALLDSVHSANALQVVQMGGSLLTTICSFVLAAALTPFVFGVLRRRNAALGSALGAGLGRLAPVLVQALVIGLATVASLFLALLPAFALATGGADAAACMLPLLSLGALVLICILLCGWFVSAQAVVVERIGPLAGLRRSWSLTRGARWQIFGVVFALRLLESMVGFGAGALLATVDLEHYLWLAETVLIILAASLGAVVSVVAYHDLRVQKEGIDAEELAAVFD